MKKWIWLDGEKTNYTIDIHGVVINQKKGKKIGKSDNMSSLSHKGKIYSNRSRMYLMAKYFISNPNNLKYAALIDPTNTKLSLDNICWTDRKNLVKH